MLYLYSNVYSSPQNLLCYCFVQSQSVIEHLRALLCRMSSVYDVCLRMEYLSSVWDVSRVECLWRGIYSMWDVSHVGCLPCGMSSVWDVKELRGGLISSRYWEASPSVLCRPGVNINPLCSQSTGLNVNRMHIHFTKISRIVPDHTPGTVAHFRVTYSVITTVLN